MSADRILILGFDKAPITGSIAVKSSASAADTSKLLKKLGYEVIELSQDQALADFLATQSLDGILIDSAYAESSLADLIDFFRAGETTRNLPIVAAVDRPRELQNIKEKRIPRLELLLKPVAIGILASRLATALRVRKLDGSEVSRASLGDINANLRDINQRFAIEREEARRIQLALLPADLPKSEHFELAVSYRPLEDVGGDWYYWSVADDGRLSFQIADITGHGISAAFISSMTKLALSAVNAGEPSALLSGMNRLLSPVLPEGRFVTMVSCNFDPQSKKLVASYAGHPPAIIYRAKDNKTEELRTAGFPLGFEEESSYTQKEIVLNEGDVVVAYSDGLSEVLNRSNQMFGTDRIGLAMQTAGAGSSAQQIMDKLFVAFDEFREDRLLKDDVTVIVVKIKSRDSA